MQSTFHLCCCSHSINFNAPKKKKRKRKRTSRLIPNQNAPNDWQQRSWNFVQSPNLYVTRATCLAGQNHRILNVTIGTIGHCCMDLALLLYWGNLLYLAMAILRSLNPEWHGFSFFNALHAFTSRSITVVNSSNRQGCFDETRRYSVL